MTDVSNSRLASVRSEITYAIIDKIVTALLLKDQRHGGKG